MIDFLNWNLFTGPNIKLSTQSFHIEENPVSGGVDFKLEFLEDCNIQEVYLEFKTSSPITKWRYLDYTWKEPGFTKWIANYHSPKIVKLLSSHYLVAKNTLGCWEYQPEIQCIRWYFYHPMLTPTLVFDELDERKFLFSQFISKGTQIRSGWRWSKGKVEEWARTPHGFISTICFTDHSDFDTIENLKIQRKFFKERGIKTTKGFFLYNYTHKEENASLEDFHGCEELKKWESDGHELAYHALSQSYRGNQSDEEFEQFESPKGFSQIDTYIDHGFHPYNYTKQTLGKWEPWYQKIQKKGICRFWTYIDAGEGNVLNVNQINPLNFNWNSMKLSSRWAKKNGLRRKKITEFRNFLMYGVTESILRKAKVCASKLGSFKKGPSIKNLYAFLHAVIVLFLDVLKPSSWNELKVKSEEIFSVNRFGSVFFLASNQKTTQLVAFQTLAVRDYDLVFSSQALETFQMEKGLMIAHTYFAYTGGNHEGRLFENKNWEIRSLAKAGFDRISIGIKEGKIWNPTLRELQKFHKGFELLEYSIQEGRLVVTNFNGFKREVS